MNLKNLRSQMDALIDELEGLRAIDDLNDDQETRVTGIIAEINELAPKIRQAEEVEALVGKHNAGRESRGTAANAAFANAGANAATREDAKQESLAKRFIESDDFIRTRESGGKFISQMNVSSFHEERALVHTGILPADYLEPHRIPGFQRPADPFGSLRDVLTVGQTDSDALIFFRETAFTNNAAVVDEASATGQSGSPAAYTGLKPESALTFDQVTSTVATIAHWIPITKQTLWNAPEVRSYIEGRLIDGLKLEEDAQLLTGNGTSGNMTGLLETTGVQDLDDTYFGTNPVASTGYYNENYNRVLRGHRMVSTVGRAISNFTVLNPIDHENFMTSVDANRQYFGAGPFNAGTVPTLWGRRVVINENMPQGSVLVGDGRMATIWDRMQAQISVGYIDNQFVRNMLTILAEERVGLTVFRPQAFAIVELAEITDDLPDEGDGGGD